MLSAYQWKILKLIKNQDYFIRTNEGSNLKAWLYKGEENMQTVRIDTVNILYKLGFLSLIEEGPSYYFDYKYSGKIF